MAMQYCGGSGICREMRRANFSWQYHSVAIFGGNVLQMVALCETYRPNIMRAETLASQCALKKSISGKSEISASDISYEM
jgi:hypothetical protein